MNYWIWIALGGIFEATWAVTLDLSDCFNDLWWGALTIGITFVSIGFLYKGLHMGAPVGGAYAVWTGCGTVFSTAFGLILFGQTLPVIGWIFLAILIGGVLLMQTAEGGDDKSQEGKTS